MPLQRLETDARRMDHIPVRKVLTLQNRKAIQLDITKPAGVPLRAFEIILDSHTRRARFAVAGHAWPEKFDADLLRRLAALGEPRWQLETDPLLWLSRVRWEIWTSALSFPDLQPDKKLHRSATLPARPTPATNTITALAAWAYRHRPSDPTFDEVCGQLFNGISGRRWEQPPLRDQASGHWLLWTGQSRGFARLETINRALALGIYLYREPDLSGRLVHKENALPENAGSPCTDQAPNPGRGATVPPVVRSGACGNGGPDQSGPHVTGEGAET